LPLSWMQKELCVVDGKEDHIDLTTLERKVGEQEGDIRKLAWFFFCFGRAKTVMTREQGKKNRNAQEKAKRWHVLNSLGHRLFEQRRKERTGRCIKGQKKGGCERRDPFKGRRPVKLTGEGSKARPTECGGKRF